MVDLIEQSRMACEQFIDVTRRAVLQAVLQLAGNCFGLIFRGVLLMLC